MEYGTTLSYSLGPFFGVEVYQMVQPLRFHISRNTLSAPLFCVILFMTGQRMPVGMRSFAIIGRQKSCCFLPDYERRGNREFWLSGDIFLLFFLV